MIREVGPDRDMDGPGVSMKENLKLAGFRSYTEGLLRRQLFYQQQLLVLRETAAHWLLTQEQNSSKLEISSVTAYLHNKDVRIL